MTKKRYRKLARAYFTFMNEWAKDTNRENLNMGDLYRRINNLENPIGMSKEEWWNALKPSAISFGMKLKGN